LHDAWDKIIHAATILPIDSAEHDRLLTLVHEVRELGFLVHKKKNYQSGIEEINEAKMPNGQRLWTDLPYLAQDCQKYWLEESIRLPAAERSSLAVLTAKLCSTGICSVELAQCALWLFKETLETDLKDSTPLPDLLPACVEWLNHCNHKLAKLSADNTNPLDSSRQLSLAPGLLTKNTNNTNITRDGFSIARWLFWRQRLGDLYLSGGPEVARTARKGFEVMVNTGFRIGIEIPGEHKFLQKTFEALDKELVKLSESGLQGCVSSSMIDVDPAWAIEEYKSLL